MKINTRHIASLIWGAIQHSTPTSIKGVSYFMSAGHGGFVAEGTCFTPEQREVIDLFGIKPTQLEVWTSNGQLMKAAYNWHWGTSRKIVTPLHWHQSFVEVFVFEHDVDWAVLWLATRYKVPEETPEDVFANAFKVACKFFAQQIDSSAKLRKLLVI